MWGDVERAARFLCFLVAVICGIAGVVFFFQHQDSGRIIAVSVVGLLFVHLAR